MIAGALIKLIPVSWRLWAALGTGAVVVAALVGVFAWIDHRGYERGVNETTVKYERELKRLETENQKVIDDANAEYGALLLKYYSLNRELDNVLIQNDEEAAAEPGSSEPGLTAGSVLRLNRIR